MKRDEPSRAVQVRAIAASDFASFDKLMRQSQFVGDPTAKQMEAFFEEVVDDQSNLLFLGAFVEGKLAGVLSLTFGLSSYKFSPFAWCDDLYVDYRHRRSGLAKELMAHARRVAQEQGCSNILLGAGQDDEAALGLYESLGFVDMQCRLMTLPIE